MPNFRGACIAFLLAFARPGAALPQAQPLITDRPDFTESPFVVPLGSVQIEAGLTRQQDRHHRETSGPEALIRWSPAERLELRLEPPGYVRSESLRGYTDTSLGAKVEVGRFGAWSVGAIASLGLPTGEDRVSVGRTVPTFILAAGRDLTEAWSVGTQGSVGRPDVGGGVVLASTLVFARALTPTLGAFLEAAAEDEPGAPAAAVLHAGLTFLLSPLLQVDIHATRGLPGTRGSSTVGLGVSTRFD